MTADDDSKKLSQERYSRFAGGYVSSPGHARGVDLERLLVLAAPQPGWRVLDVATGGGHTALKVEPHVRQVVASDLTEKMLMAARAFLRQQAGSQFRFSVADAEALPFRDASFDLVTCRIAPHHFPAPAWFICEASRVVPAGGLVLIQDHLLPDDPAAGLAVDAFERRRDPSHCRAFSRLEWEAMFAQAGLVVKAVDTLVKRHELVSWVERQGGGPVDIAELRAMLPQLPQIAQDWLEPRDWDQPKASFVNHHLIILGRKDTPENEAGDQKLKHANE